MLRLGHLTVVCKAAVEAGGGTHRFEKNAADQLMRTVSVQVDSTPTLARYLRAKKLCPDIEERRSVDFDEVKYRYPDIVLMKVGDEDRLDSWPTGSPSVEILWQDLCLSVDGVQSRVGSVTARGK